MGSRRECRVIFISMGIIIGQGFLSSCFPVANNPAAPADESGSTVLPSQTSLSLDGAVRTILRQSDGMILLGGDFTRPLALLRFNADGSLDRGFVSKAGSGPNGSVTAIAVQIGGKVIVGGNFTDFNGTSVGRMCRLQTDGSLDLEFNSALGSGFDDRVNSLVIQPDGAILVGGVFTRFNGTTVPRVVRLTSAGQLDTAFVSRVSSAPTSTPTATSTPTPTPTPTSTGKKKDKD